MTKIRKCKDSGFTIIELLVVFMIVSVAIVALFVGIQFAEKHIYKNYHNRQALLIASAELEYQYYRKTIYGAFSDEASAYGDTVILDDSPQNRIEARISQSRVSIVSEDIYQLPQTIVTVEVSWKEPADDNKTRTVRLIEDYYDSPQN